jgi:pyruvate formate lyase activating enzyme
MGTCRLCHAASAFVASALGACLGCLRTRPEEALPLAREAHRRSRSAFSLPETPPGDPRGLLCTVCANACRIPEGGIGYCGIRRNEEGRPGGVSSRDGKLSWYHDPLPTNCVADWVCPGGTGAGYPAFARRPGPEAGCANLAVFFHACSFDCLYCQNWQYRRLTPEPKTTSVDALVAAVDERTSCICYFGGDPAPQLPFSLEASRRALDNRKGSILRVCWETNGSMAPHLLDEMVALALASGGCVKFDIKAWDEAVHIALTGVSNRRTLANIARAAKSMASRPVPPLVVASTLLVPGYVDEEEVGAIARFLASLDPAIPYALLAFHPLFYLYDLPPTSRRLAQRCLQAAHGAGLANVRIGNVHLLA